MELRVHQRQCCLASGLAKDLLIVLAGSNGALMRLSGGSCGEKEKEGPPRLLASLLVALSS